MARDACVHLAGRMQSWSDVVIAHAAFDQGSIASSTDPAPGAAESGRQRRPEGCVGQTPIFALRGLACLAGSFEASLMEELCCLSEELVGQDPTAVLVAVAGYFLEPRTIVRLELGHVELALRGIL